MTIAIIADIATSQSTFTRQIITAQIRVLEDYRHPSIKPFDVEQLEEDLALLTNWNPAGTPAS